MPDVDQSLRCNSCGHPQDTDCGCTCCGPQLPAWVRCPSCRLHYRRDRDHIHGQRFPGRTPNGPREDRKTRQ